MNAASNPALYCEAKPVPMQQLVCRSLHETFADVNLFPVCNCREKHNPSETQKDRQLSRSMSPIRGDVKKKTPPSSPQEAADVVACIQPDLQLEKSFAACTPDRP